VVAPEAGVSRLASLPLSPESWRWSGGQQSAIFPTRAPQQNAQSIYFMGT